MRSSSRNVVVAFVAVLAVLGAAQTAAAATFTVTTTSDGATDCEPICSLRDNILRANATPEADTINFRIGTGAQTIVLDSSLPPVTGQVTIDGTTQPGWIGPPLIEITTRNPDASGLDLQAPGSVLNAVAVNGLRTGVRLTGSTLLGSYVGTNLAGTAAAPNGVGVLVAGSNSTVGSTIAAGRNTISGNTAAGIHIVGSQNAVENNNIGTDAAGTVELPNGGHGILIEGGSSNSIGGDVAQVNVIAGNEGDGIRIVRGNGNRIVNNRIGTDRGATVGLGNLGTGVRVESGDNNQIGDVEFPPNIIANNGLTNTGVWIESGTGNSVLRNSIDDNGGLGIDLGANGVTPNDTGDGDSGANNLQNFPVLTAAETDGGSIAIRGTLETQTGRPRLEFFASYGCDSSSYGEGQRFLGARIIDSTGGTAEFDETLSAVVSAGESVTATATLNGSTSEFSRCVTAERPPEAPADIIVNSTADPGDGECLRAECTLREAITVANSNVDASRIVFDIPGGPPHTIRLASPLPLIGETVEVDGTTEPDYDGTTPVVRVDGFRVVANVLTLATDESTVRGLELIRGNAAGLEIRGNGNTVAQNVIGGDDLDNGIGVLVNGSSNTIGGAGAANELSFNSGPGVRIATGAGNRILQNSIHSNGGLGIDLAPNGVNTNDRADADTGANGRQNFPVLTRAQAVSGSIDVVGTLDSAPASSYRLEFFGDSGCDPSDHGEGRRFLGSTSVETNADGIAPFEATVENRDDAFVTATATDADGSTSEFSVCRAVGDTGEGLTLTVDRGANPAGSNTQSVGLAAIPSNQLNAFSGSPDSAPVGSTPVGSIPVGSIPVGSIPVGSIPVGSIPVGSIPVGSIPVGSIPVGSIGLEAIPVGSIGLDQILLPQLPVDWTPIFAGTPLAGLVLQTLTLEDVYANATARARFEALTLAQSGLQNSLLGGVTFAALLLGDKTLSQLPPPEAATWCAAITAAGGSCAGLDLNANTVTGLSIASVPVGSIPVGSIPVGSIAGGIAGTPVGSIPVGSIDIAATPLAAILLNTIPNVNQVVDCSRISCTTDRTLGHAAALTPSAIRPTAVLAALQSVLGNITLNELIVGIVPRSALAWEQFPIDGLQLFTPRPVTLRYTVNYDLDCANKAGLAISVKLPEGDIVLPGTTTLGYDDLPEVAGPNPTTDATTGARWTGLPEPCPGSLASRHIRLSFDALSGFDLGVGAASARVVAAGETRSVVNQAPVLITQNWEQNDEVTPTAPLIQPDELVIGHIARSGDQEVFRTAIPTVPGTVTTFYLSHIAEGADFDVVVGVPGVPPLQSAPVGSIPVGSIPIEDKGSDVENSSEALPPETLQDIPVGSIPVGSISANRGSADEVAEVVARGETGFYTVVVRGYNGSFSREPFVLRVKRTPAPVLPACAPRGLTLPARGTLPATLPADTQTLFLFNRQRMGALHGVAATNTMVGSLTTLAQRPEVKGALLPVDGATPVRTAYTAWDANPCSVEAANTVVRRINDVVAGYRANNGLPNLRYVVLLGSDDAVPMARVPDRVSVSPELDFASGLQFTTQNLTAGNAIYSAAALSYFLTDGGYAAFTNIPWLGRELLLPQVSVSRLVESSADITAQLDQYVTENGVLDPETALTTGYDFLTDGANATKTALDLLVGPGNGTSLISDTWTKNDFVTRFTGKTPPDDVNALSAHYSQWQLQPASAATAQDLVTTADVPAPGLDPAFKNRILFTVGCHGGYNVPNTLLSGPLPPQARDWAESWARQRAAVYVANTGFGYGDTVANALSERLMSIFASKLTQAKPIGELWNDAQHEYFGGAGAYDVYDEKALVEATLFGLPHWRIAGATAPTTPPAPPLVNDPVSGLPVAQLNVNPLLNLNLTSFGRFWDFAGRAQVTHFRPIQPRAERDVTVPGQTAHGIIIKSLQTNDVAGVDPVLATPTIDLSAHEPERNFRDVVFPANLVNLTRSRGLRGDRQGFVVNAGQFRPATPAGPTGIERLVQSVGVEIAYSNSSDVTPPSIRQVGSSFTGSAASIFVEAVEPAKRVAAMYNDASVWRFVELTNVAGTTMWTANVPVTHAIEVAAMAQDDAGNVGYSVNKGFNFLSIADVSGPEILIDSPTPTAEYRLNQEVKASYACSDPSGVRSCVGTVPNGATLDTSTLGAHTFTVTATDLQGRVSTKSVTYFVRFLLGNETIEPAVDENDPGLAEAFRYVAASTGPVTEIRVYLDATSAASKLVVGLYADRGNRPGTLLTQGARTGVQNGAWNSVTVPAANVAMGTRYWLAVMAPEGDAMLAIRDHCCAAGAPPPHAPSETSFLQDLTAMPATWRTGERWPVDGPASIAAYGG